MEGHEVAIHTVNHDTQSDSDKTKWEREIVNAREYLARFGASNHLA